MCTAPCCDIPCHTVLCGTALCSTVPSYAALCCTALRCRAPNCAALCCAALCCTAHVMLSSALLHCPVLHCSVTSCSMLRCCAARCCDVLCCAVMPSVVCAFVHMPHSVLLLSPSSMFRLAIGHSFAFLFLECHLQMSTRSALLFFYFIFLSPCSNATVLGNSNMTLLFPCSRGSSLCSTFPVPSHNAAYHGYYHGYVYPPHPCPSVDYKIHEVGFFFFSGHLRELVQLPKNMSA